MSGAPTGAGIAGVLAVMAALTLASPTSARPDEPLPRDRGGLVAIAIDHDADPERRRGAVVALADIVDPEVQKLLRELTLEDPDPFVRIAAARSLVAQRGAAERDTLQVALAKDQHAEGKSTLLELLERIRPLEPIEDLRRALAAAERGEDQVRLLAEVARHPADVALPVLESSLAHDPDPVVREAALELLPRVDLERGLARAAQVLEDAGSSARLRAAAIRATARHALPERAVALLRSRLAGTPSDALVLDVAVAARDHGLVALAPDLLVLLERAATPAQRAALVPPLLALVSRPPAPGATSEDLLAELVAVMDELPPLDSVPFEHAARLIDAIGREGGDAHGAALAAQLPQLKQVELVERAARALGRIAGPGAGKALVLALPTQPPSAQVEILRALARLRRPSDWPLLAAQVAHVRDPAALRALLACTGAIAPPEDGARVVQEVMQRKDATGPIRRDGVLTLAWLGPEVGLSGVLAALSDSDPHLVGTAAKALRRLAPELSAPQLVQVHEHLSRVSGSGRSVLVMVLGYTAQPEAADLLERILDNGALEAEHPAALRGLAMLGPTTADRLAAARAILERADSLELRSAAAFYLGRAGDATDAARLLAVAAQTRPLTASAALALSELGAAEAADAMAGWIEEAGGLNQGLADQLYSMYAVLPGPAVVARLERDATGRGGARSRHRTEAAVALANRGEAPAARILLAALEQEKRDSVVETLARALGALGAVEATAPLIARYEATTDVALRRAIAEALGGIADDTAKAFLARELATAAGRPEALSILLAAARRGVEISPRTARKIAQAATESDPLPAGIFALAGDAAARRWLWRDIRSPHETHQGVAHLALRELGERAYVDLVLARATLEAFPRREVRVVAAHLDGAPRLRVSSRPDQDADLAALRAWWRERRDRLTWDAATRRFVEPR